jgi:predicted O-linked N-acetylglucosamine transferase (SPINDLY family)
MSTPDQLLQEGLTALNRRKWFDAERLFADVLKTQPKHVGALNLLTVALMNMERFAEAETHIAKAVKLNPGSDVSFYNYGLILKRLDKPELALKQFDSALRLNAKVAETWNNRGIVLNDLKRYEDAIVDFDKALVLQPDYADANCNKGKTLVYLRRYDEALNAFEKALAIKPDLTAAWLGSGIVLFYFRRYSDALNAYDKVLAVEPGSLEGWLGRGKALAELRRYDQAFVAFDQALAIDPGCADAWLGRGNVLYYVKRHDEAAAAFTKALAIEPDLAPAWLGRGNVLLAIGQYRDAELAFTKALALKPEMAEAWLGRGNVLKELKRYDEAAAAYDEALALKADLAEAWSGRGNIFAEFQRFDDAFPAYDRAVMLKPALDYAVGLRLYAKLHLCNWTDLASDIARLDSMITARETLVEPFVLLAIPSSPAEQLRCTTLRVQDRPTFTAIWGGEVYSHDRIRVAYVSSELREHAVAYLTAGLFEQHDRSRFEVTAIAFEPGGNTDFCRRIRSAFDRFVDVSGQNDQEIADLIRRLEIDIVVDLNGFTRNSRYGVFARRPAPVQVNYLGYAGTMGADYYDYLVADPTVIPEEDFEFYSEKIVWLPDSFMVNDATRPIAEHTPSRRELGLPNDAFVFCCFNQLFKISPAIFDVWMRLLREAPGSVLWMKEAGVTAMHNLRLEAERRGVAPERLVFAPSVAHVADHLARQRQADLFLDTIYYNAHTTTADALWAGLPVATCFGSTFAGRVAASLLKAVGLPELITTSLADYEDLALRLARDPSLLAATKAKLARNRLSYPLFDTKRFTRHMEAAYATMVDTYRRGESPRSFSVDPQ